MKVTEFLHLLTYTLPHTLILSHTHKHSYALTHTFICMYVCMPA